MSDFTVTGESSPDGVDGTYTQNGMHSGEPAYERDVNGAFWIYFSGVPGQWIIDNVLGAAPPFIFYSSTGGITGTYLAAIKGTDPGPIVAAIVTGVSIPILINSDRQRRI